MPDSEVSGIINKISGHWMHKKLLMGYVNAVLFLYIILISWKNGQNSWLLHPSLWFLYNPLSPPFPQSPKHFQNPPKPSTFSCRLTTWQSKWIHRSYLFDLSAVRYCWRLIPCKTTSSFSHSTNAYFLLILNMSVDIIIFFSLKYDSGTPELLSLDFLLWIFSKP